MASAAELSSFDLQNCLEVAAARARPHLGEGKVADYIPALGRIDPKKFGLAAVTVAGEAAYVGDAQEPFSIQSISKAFTLTMALKRHGDAVWQRVGREASGSSFNSIVQLEKEDGIPRNPFINAGAIVIADMILDGRAPSEAVAEVLQFTRGLAADPKVFMDEEVAQSEKETGFRNASLANFMKGFGNIRHPVADALYLYFHQCSLAMTCLQLARAGLYLAAHGYCPLSRTQVISPELARRIKAIMLTCGHYDASGDFAYSVGLPGKSGVGGGILAIVPETAAIAVWSPGLNAQGNSLAGTVALESLAREAGWSVF